MLHLWVVVLVLAWTETALGARSCSYRPVAACSCWNSRRPTIVCMDAGLTQLPELTTHYINSLDLSNNNITLQPNDKLGHEGLVLSKLILARSLSKSSEPNIPDGFFSHVLQYLRWLDMSKNNMAVIPEAVKKLENVEHLDLSDNIISKIRKSDFVNFENLKELYLAGNPIRRVHKESFQPTHQLMSLSLTLRKDAMSTNNAQFTQNLNNLKSLYIKSRHRLKSTSKNRMFFSGFKNLEVLKIEDSLWLAKSTSDVSQFCMFFSKFKKTLKKLILPHNRITGIRLSLQFQKFRKLELLDLSWNRITSINLLDVDMPSLKTLNLQYNWINSLSKVDKPLSPKALKVIDLRGNSGIDNIQKSECAEWTKTNIKLLLSSSLSCYHCESGSWKCKTDCLSIEWAWPIKQGNYSTFNSCIHPDNDGLLCDKPDPYMGNPILQYCSRVLHCVSIKGLNC